VLFVAAVWLAGFSGCLMAGCREGWLSQGLSRGLPRGLVALLGCLDGWLLRWLVAGCRDG